MFGEKFKAQWQGDNDRIGLADKLSVIGTGISQLYSGQTPNIMPAWEAVEARRSKRKLTEAMGSPAFVSGFTPQQQAMLSAMPPEMAQSLIMEKMFAPPPEPIKADWQEFGGDMYNMNDIDPATGKPRMTFDGMSSEQIDAGKLAKDRELRKQDGLMLGYAEGSPEMNNYLVTGKPIEEGGNEAGLTPFIGLDKDGNQVMLQPTKDGSVVQSKMPDGITPDFGAMSFEKARGAADGKATGEASTALDSLSAKMPGLEVVVEDLNNLADKATYTWAGQTLDAGRKQLGMDPRDAAVARAEYIAKVDNQVLPLLRDTFGAAFTVKEGETLRATLGDPDKSPAEKKAVLAAFIEQKKRDVAALEAQTGVSKTVAIGDLDFTTMSPADLGQVDISKLTEAQMTAMLKRFDEVNK